MLCIGDVGELKGLGGAESARKIPTLIPHSSAAGLGSFFKIPTIKTTSKDRGCFLEFLNENSLLPDDT
jgi:hypothetical protein